MATVCVTSRRSIRKEWAEKRSGATVEARDAAGGRLDVTQTMTMVRKPG